MSDDQSVHALLGAYVVDAVSDIERAAFEDHLSECEDCRAEVASLREVTATLADAEAIDPPPVLKARVMEQISRTPQLTPTPAEPEETDAPAVARESGQDAPATARPRRRLWAPLTAAAATVAVAAVGVALLLPGAEPADTSAMERDVMMVASAPDAHSMDLDLGATHVVVSERMESVALMGAETPMPSDGMEYQLWLLMDDGSTMAGPTFMPDKDGEVMTMMHASLADVSSIAVTVEPMGGSSQPTSDVLAIAGM